MKRRLDTGKWEVRWRENGRNRSRSFSVKADAARFELGVRRARELGGPLDLDRGRETVAEFMERWWRDYAVTTLSDNTRDCYARIWERHVRRRLGGYRLGNRLGGPGRRLFDLRRRRGDRALCRLR